MNQFLKDKTEIVAWLYAMLINDYTLVSNKGGGFTVDVRSDVNLQNKNFQYIPVQFGEVKGNFFCNDNHLTHLLGSPKVVTGGFYCDNNNLTTLLGSPYTVREHFFCHTNLLTSLEHAPHHVGATLNCRWNQISSLKGCPQYVGGTFDCADNRVESIDALPKTLGQFLRLANNPQLGDFSRSLTFEEAQTLNAEYRIKTEKNALILGLAQTPNLNYHQSKHKI